MKGYSANEVFQHFELAYFDRAKAIVNALPEHDTEGRLLRCHEVARVVGGLLGLSWVDGTYEAGAEHSWLVISKPCGKYRWWCILDPYAVGRLPPCQLIAVVPTMPNRYAAGAARTDIRDDVVKYLKELF